MIKKITALKVQKKNPERINVYLDGEFAFGLSRIVAAWLHIGQELNQGKIDSLLADDEVEVAYQRALNYLSYRSRSSYEIEQKLEKVGFESRIIQSVIKKLIEKEYINDRKFAEMWVENRALFRPKSYRVLRWELKQKKISEDIIGQVLENSTPEFELAEAAAKKYVRRIENLDFDEYKKKMTGFLARRGFSYNIVNEIVQDMWESKQNENMDHNNGNEVNLWGTQTHY